METVACPETEVFAALIALIETDDGDGTDAGALYKPPVPMVPTVLFPPVIPLTCHETDWLVAPLTVAVNLCVLPVRTAACAGETPTVILGVIVTLAVPKADGVLLLAASTITVGDGGTVEGAV